MFPFATGSDARGANAGAPRNSQVQHDGGPALRAAIERIIVKIVKSLQTMAGVTTTIEGTFSSLTLDKAKDVLAAHGPDAGAALLECTELRLPILVTLDATLVHTIVELLCGGDGAEQISASARAVTPIDLQFSQIVFSLAASAIQSEWAQYGFAGTRVAKIEGGLAADLLGPRGQEVATIKIAIGAFGLHGALRLTMPKVALDRFVRPGDAGEATAGSDPSWTAMFNKQIGQASVALDAYVDANAITLATLANLKVGQMLEMPLEARERVTLVHGDRVLYRGALGQADDLYSMRIDEIVLEQSRPVTIEPQRSSNQHVSKA